MLSRFNVFFVLILSVGVVAECLQMRPCLVPLLLESSIGLVLHPFVPIGRLSIGVNDTLPMRAIGSGVIFITAIPALPTLPHEFLFLGGAFALAFTLASAIALVLPLSGSPLRG